MHKKSTAALIVGFLFNNAFTFQLSSRQKFSSTCRHGMQEIISQVEVWSGLNGLLYGELHESNAVRWIHAPVALMPNFFPKSAFEYTQKVQPIIAKLIDRLSRDKLIINENLKDLAVTDNFVWNLLNIYNNINNDDIKTQFQLGIHRSDYMLDHVGNHYKPLQVEMNTIASSFGCLSQKVGNLHKYLLRRNTASSSLMSILRNNSDISLPGTLSDVADLIPANENAHEFAAALALANGLHSDKKSVILFVVQPGERNVRELL